MITRFVVLLVLTKRYIRRVERFQSFGSWMFLTALAVFGLGAARSQPWHLVWPLSLAGLSDLRWSRFAVGVLSVVMVGAQIWIEWGAPCSLKYY